MRRTPGVIVCEIDRDPGDPGFQLGFAANAGALDERAQEAFLCQSFRSVRLSSERH